MGFPVGKLASIATRVLTAIVTTIPVVERARSTFKAGSGAQKKEAVLDVARAELAAAELIAGRDLANDADVVEALGALIDAGAKWHNLLARKTAAPTP